MFKDLDNRRKVIVELERSLATLEAENDELRGRVKAWESVDIFKEPNVIAGGSVHSEAEVESLRAKLKYLEEDLKAQRDIAESEMEIIRVDAETKVEEMRQGMEND